MRAIAMAALLLGHHAAQAAFERHTPGAEAAGMGGSAAAYPVSCWSVLHNPALLARLPTSSAALHHVPASFGLTELRRSALAGALVTDAGVVALAVESYGFELYREVTVGAGWAAELIAGIEGGVTVHHNALSISGYGSAGVFGLDVGAAVRPVPGVVWGLSIRNLNASRIGETGERLPRSLVVGGAYTPVDEVVLTADLEKDVRFPWELGVGVAYAPADPVVLRIGTRSGTSTLHGGAGITAGLLRFEYAYVHHPELGGTHHLGITLFPGASP